MDLVNSTISWVIDFAAKSESTYHVNPWIFCVLFFGSAIPLYYGYYRIGKSFLKFEDRKIKKKQVNKKELKVGIMISIVSWWIPYLYVIVFGRLSWNYWLIFYTFVLIMGLLFIRSVLKRINNR